MVTKEKVKYLSSPKEAPETANNVVLGASAILGIPFRFAHIIDKRFHLICKTRLTALLFPESPAQSYYMLSYSAGRKIKLPLL